MGLLIPSEFPSELPLIIVFKLQGWQIRQDALCRKLEEGLMGDFLKVAFDLGMPVGFDQAFFQLNFELNHIFYAFVQDTDSLSRRLLHPHLLHPDDPILAPHPGAVARSPHASAPTTPADTDPPARHLPTLPNGHHDYPRHHPQAGALHHPPHLSRASPTPQLTSIPRLRAT